MIADIIVAAIEYITKIHNGNQASGSEGEAGATARRTAVQLKLLRRQNRRLREIFRREFHLNLSETDFLQKNVKEVLVLIAEAKERDRKRDEERKKAEEKRKESDTTAATATTEDVFVAPLGGCVDDHTYSLVVQETSDVVVEMGDEEEEVCLLLFLCVGSLI